MIRLIDFCLALLGLIILSPVILILMVLGYFDTGSPMFRQTRVGKNKKHFTLYKFRTMAVDTRSVATHMVDAKSVTRLGKFLRGSKLDELPQLYNVLKGEMSLVGPRPCLPNQEDLIGHRQRLGVYGARPGITGYSQLVGIDMSTPKLLAESDAKMIESFSFYKYLKYLLETLSGKGSGDRIVTEDP